MALKPFSLQSILKIGWCCTSPGRSGTSLQVTFFQRELGKSAHIFVQNGQLQKAADDDQVSVACRYVCLPCADYILDDPGDFFLYILTTPVSQIRMELCVGRLCVELLMTAASFFAIQLCSLFFARLHNY
jgi:hypothetical protein